MKIGKVSQTVLKRSILKQLHYKRFESVIQASMEEMCASVRTGESSQTVLTDACLYGNEKELGVYAIARAVNDLASRGAEPIGMGIRLHLPPHAYESRLKAMTEYMEKAACENEVQIFYLKAEVSPVIRTAIVSVSAVGQIKEGGRLLLTKHAKPDSDIVLVRPVGIEGTLRILGEKEEWLSGRFVKAFINPIKDWQKQIFSVKEIQKAISGGADAVHQISDGGILAGLWDLTESAGLGMEVSMKRFLIRQETIEFCEYLKLNPYQLASAGSVLVTCPDGEAIVREMNALGAEAAVLGRTTKGNDRVILNGEERRFLDRPMPDEILKLYSADQEE